MLATHSIDTVFTELTMSNNSTATAMWGRSPQRNPIDKSVSSPADGAEGPSNAVASPGGTFRHPDELQKTDSFAQASMEMGEQLKDTKASAQQEHVVVEHFQCCQHELQGDPHAMTLNAADKANRFMLRQALREQKQKGGMKESRALAEAGVFFDSEDCKRVMGLVDKAATCPIPDKKICPITPPGVA